MEQMVKGGPGIQVSSCCSDPLRDAHSRRGREEKWPRLILSVVPGQLFEEYKKERSE